MITTGDPDREYEEIAIIVATGPFGNPDDVVALNDALREKARQLGADAVIRITYEGDQAIGTAVRFINGES